MYVSIGWPRNPWTWIIVHIWTEKNSYHVIYWGWPSRAWWRPSTIILILYLLSLPARDKHMQASHTAQKSQRIFRKWQQDKCAKQYRNKCFTVRRHEVLLGLILTSEVLKQLGHGGKWNGKHWRTRQNEQGEVLDNLACFKCLTTKRYIHKCAEVTRNQEKFQLVHAERLPFRKELYFS